MNKTEDSDRVPYAYKFTQNNHYDHASMPLDIAKLIFTDPRLTHQEWGRILRVCKTWNRLLLSDELGTKMLERCGIAQYEETWLKTYHVWLTKQVYIVVDCSQSMLDHSELVDNIVLQIAVKIFNKKLKNGVRLGLFGLDFVFTRVFSEPELKSLLPIEDLKPVLALTRDYIRTRHSNMIPILNEIYYRFITEDLKNETDIHIITDGGFHDANETKKFIEAYFKKTEYISTHFYRVGMG